MHLRISIDMQPPFCIQGCRGSKARLDMKTQLLYSSVNLMAFHWTDKRPLNHSSAREMLYAHSFPVAHRSEINGVHRDRARGRLEGSGIAKLSIMHVCACSGRLRTHLRQYVLVHPACCHTILARPCFFFVFFTTIHWKVLCEPKTMLLWYPCKKKKLLEPLFLGV